MLQELKFIFKCYVDSYFVDDLDKRNSLQVICTPRRRIISWVSKLQTVVTLFITKVEYIVATHVYKEIA